ncbi:MAG TPA: alpha-amylase family glycosyl hydrolase [Candidatus Acidoferrales bacterium]|jgi:glycosidase|nr:alpha-amylase family glycosyl hydrolase [Candidatus Acidoferrales bacterium]
MTVLKSCVLAFFALACGAAPKVEKVEPPNWWAPHTFNPVQVLLTGSGLQSATVTSASKAIKPEVRFASADGRYLFVYLDIARNAAPGPYRFDVKSAAGGTTFTFALERPLDPHGRFQGFSPDDVIYLLMPDRFANGDPSNDSPPEFGRPADRNTVLAYHGGDLRGVRERLGYLKDLGVTGVWMTPVYKNSNTAASPYHGYHTVDFYAVEPRFGTMAEFRGLVDAAHAAGVKVVQDQVANHSGPHHPWVTNPPTRTWFNFLDRTPRPRNNFDIAALSDPYARPKRLELPLRGWFAGSLPDFNQDDPLMSDYLVQNALWWIGMTGVDAIRQDTYPYVDRPFWQQWQAAITRQYPKLVVVGEITAPSPASLSFFQGGVKHGGIDTGLASMLDFPLQRATREVFAQGQPMTRLTDVLAQDSLYLHPEMLVAFAGNHDGERMLTAAGGDIGKLLMAQSFLLTTRRTVHLYYGDEIAIGKGGDRTDRGIRADFPGGFPADMLPGAVNAFTPEGRTGDAAVVFDWMRRLLHFRQAHTALRRGRLVQLFVTADQYAYLRSAPEESVLVVLNRAGAAKPVEIELDDLLGELAIPDGLRFRPWGAGPELPVSSGKVVIAQPKEIEIYWATR